jgi:hypothetical protein
MECMQAPGDPGELPVIVLQAGSRYHSATLISLTMPALRRTAEEGSHTLTEHKA